MMAKQPGVTFVRRHRITSRAGDRDIEAVGCVHSDGHIGFDTWLITGSAEDGTPLYGPRAIMTPEEARQALTAFVREYCAEQQVTN